MPCVSRWHTTPAGANVHGSLVLMALCACSSAELRQPIHTRKCSTGQGSLALVRNCAAPGWAADVVTTTVPTPLKPSTSEWYVPTMNISPKVVPCLLTITRRAKACFKLGAEAAVSQSTQLEGQSKASNVQCTTDGICTRSNCWGAAQDSCQALILAVLLLLSGYMPCNWQWGSSDSHA